MKYCDACGRKIGYCVDASTRRRIILDVDQKVYTPKKMSEVDDVDNGFEAIRNTLSAAVHLCPRKKP